MPILTLQLTILVFILIYYVVAYINNIVNCKTWTQFKVFVLLAFGWKGLFG